MENVSFVRLFWLALAFIGFALALRLVSGLLSALWGTLVRIFGRDLRLPRRIELAWEGISSKGNCSRIPADAAYHEQLTGWIEGVDLSVRYTPQSELKNEIVSGYSRLSNDLDLTVIPRNNTDYWTDTYRLCAFDTRDEAFDNKFICAAIALERAQAFLTPFRRKLLLSRLNSPYPWHIETGSLQWRISIPVVLGNMEGPGGDANVGKAIETETLRLVEFARLLTAGADSSESPSGLN